MPSGQIGPRLVLYSCFIHTELTWYGHNIKSEEDKDKKAKAMYRRYSFPTRKDRKTIYYFDGFYIIYLNGLRALISFRDDLLDLFKMI